MAGAGGNKSARLAAQRKVMDEATRRRRARKALESLEQDNAIDDPHADLVMSKKALNLFQDNSSSSSLSSAGTAGAGSGNATNAGNSSQPKPSSKRKSRTTEYYKQRFRKNFAQLLEEDATQNGGNDPAIGQQPQQPQQQQDDGKSEGVFGGLGNVDGKTGKAKDSKKRAKKKVKRVINYISAQAPPSSKPLRHFCAVCGFTSAYTCIVCGMRYCSLPCQETHRDTRCLKYTS